MRVTTWGSERVSENSPLRFFSYFSHLVAHVRTTHGLRAKTVALSCSLFLPTALIFVTLLPSSIGVLTVVSRIFKRISTAPYLVVLPFQLYNSTDATTVSLVLRAQSVSQWSHIPSRMSSSSHNNDLLPFALVCLSSAFSTCQHLHAIQRIPNLNNQKSIMQLCSESEVLCSN